MLPRHVLRGRQSEADSEGSCGDRVDGVGIAWRPDLFLFPFLFLSFFARGILLLELFACGLSV